MPTIHKEWVEVISQFQQSKKVELWICVDDQENVFRSRNGNVEAIWHHDSLAAIIKQCKGLRFGF